MIQRVQDLSKSFLRKAAPGVYERLKGRRGHPFRGEINLILKGSQAPQAFDKIQIFQDLQSKYPPFPAYGYDRESVYKRGMERSNLLMEIIPCLKTTGQKVFEAGSGDSMVAFALSQKGHDLMIMDKADWRDDRAKKLAFIQGNLSQPFVVESNTMDACYSFNAFEHVDDPKVTFAEMLRTLKPGGFMYLDFNPLYASPWGMHLYRSLRMPYCQFLFSHDFLLELKVRIGVNDIGQVDEPLQPLNKWKPSQFMDLWKYNRSCEVLFCETLRDTKHLNIIREFAPAFRGRQLSYEDVTTSGIKVLIRKRK